MGRSLALTFLATTVLACGASTAPDQSAFLLSGAWGGELRSTADNRLFAEFQITLVGKKDGATQEYQGDGNLFGTFNPRRFQQVEASYDTVATSVSIRIFDFPLVLNQFVGSYDGTALFIADSLVCGCWAALSR